MTKEELFDSLGFTYHTMGEEGVDFCTWYEKEYKTKLGVFTLGVDWHDREYCIYYMTPDDNDTKLCPYSLSSLYEWDEYFNKIKEL